MSGLFGDVFDFDHDGEMDCFEKATEFNFLQDLMDDERSERMAERGDIFDDEEDAKKMTTISDHERRTELCWEQL